MFGIQKLLSLSFAFSLGLISLLFLSAYSDTLFSFPFLEASPGTEKQMCTACSSSTCDGKVFRRYSKVIFCLLRAWRSWALFHLAHRKSERQMWKWFHRWHFIFTASWTGRHSITHFPRVQSWRGHLNHVENLALSSCLLWHLQFCWQLRMVVFVWRHEGLSLSC